MKIKKRYIVILVMVLIALVAYKLIDIKMAKEYEIYVNDPTSYNESINVSIPEDSTVLEYENDHGGVHGDGESYVAIQLSDVGATEFIAQGREIANWEELPLSDDISHFIVGGVKDDVDYGDGYLEFGGDKLKGIVNGIYYFHDRFIENYPEYADTDRDLRPAENFTIAVFDTDTNILHICEFDT